MAGVILHRHRSSGGTRKDQKNYFRRGEIYWREEDNTLDKPLWSFSDPSFAVIFFPVIIIPTYLSCTSWILSSLSRLPIYRNGDPKKGMT